MEKLVIFVALALSAVISNAQEVIELQEAKVEFSPVSQNITNPGNSFSVNIKENYIGEFEKDPMAFMTNNFDMKKVIAELGVYNYTNYEVSFISTKGELIVNFDGNGEKTGSFMRFRDMALPSQLQHQLYRDHKGWALMKTLRIARESNGKVDKDYYKITMEKGNKKRKFKINASDVGLSTLVAGK